MDINEINRLAAAGSAMRPDWPAKSLATFLGKNLADRAYGDVAVALAWICTRTKTNTPRLLLEAGPWWKATVADGGTLAPRPPTKEEACATCGLRQEQHGKGAIASDHQWIPVSQASRGRTPMPDYVRQNRYGGQPAEDDKR